MYLWLNFINSFYTVHYSLKCNRRTFTNLLYTLTFVVTNKKTLTNLVFNFSNSMRLALNEKIYEWLCFDMQKVLTLCHNSKFARFRRIIDLYVVGLQIPIQIQTRSNTFWPDQRTRLSHYRSLRFDQWPFLRDGQP